jgi:CHASE3 domain sensor protein
MRSIRSIRTLTAVFLMALTPWNTAFADERHAVTPSALADTIASKLQQQDADRAVVRQAVDQPAVRDVASKLGIDMDRTREAVETLSGDDLRNAAQTATQINEALVGGQTMTFSVTTIIIILLVVILIIVAVD